MLFLTNEDVSKNTEWCSYSNCHRQYQGVQRQRYRLTRPNTPLLTVHWVSIVVHPAASDVHSFLHFLKSSCAGTAPLGVVAQVLFKMGLLDCFITEVAQQYAQEHYYTSTAI